MRQYFATTSAVIPGESPPTRKFVRHPARLQPDDRRGRKNASLAGSLYGPVNRKTALKPPHLLEIMTFKVSAEIAVNFAEFTILF